MNASRVPVRLSGAVVCGGAVGLGVALVLLAFQPVADRQPSAAAAGILLLSAILLIVGLPGVYAVQARASGALGLVGHLLLTLGLFLLVLYSGTPLLYPELREAPPQNLLLFVPGMALTAGLLLTAAGAWRARVLPRPASVLLFAATLGFFFDFFIAELLPPFVIQLGAATVGALLGVSFGWLGIALLRMRLTSAS